MSLSLIFPSHQSIVTCAAMTRSILSYSCVFLIELMISLTMSFFSIQRRNSKATHIIFFRRHRFKMIWIHARWVSTKMVDMKTFLNFTLVKFIRESMRTHHFFMSSKCSISIRPFICSPKPAAIGFLNFIEKPFLKGTAWLDSIFMPPIQTFDSIVFPNFFLCFHRGSLTQC